MHLSIIQEEMDTIFEEKDQRSYSRVSLPQLSEVQYSPALASEENKRCGNCVFWARDKHCVLHASDLEVSAHHVCHSWIGGQSKSRWEHIGLETPLNPDFSGLEITKHGISCDSCKHYFWEGDERGLCDAVLDDEAPAKVSPKASCSRWEMAEVRKS